MPRRCLSLLLAALCSARCVTASPPLCARAQKADTLYTASREELQVVKVVLAQQAAWNRGDLDGFIARYKDADDTVAILGSPAHGMAAIRSAFHVNYPKADAMGSIEYTDVQARELGENFALATGRYHLDRSRKAGGPADGNFTDVFEKTPAGWLIIFSETT